MIPPWLIGATPPPPGLDRVFPPALSDPDWGDLYVATLHPDRRMTA